MGRRRVPCWPAAGGLLALVLFASCGRSKPNGPKEYAVGLGIQAVRGKREVLCFALQHIKGQRVLAAVCWRSEPPGGTVNADLAGRPFQINGKPVELPLEEPGVYALQEDYTLEPLAVPEKERDALFERLRTESPTPKVALDKDETWRVYVAPRLKLVPRA